MKFRFLQNAELFTLTYGATVRQLLTDLEEVEEVNKQLDQMCAFSISFSFNIHWKILIWSEWLGTREKYVAFRGICFFILEAVLFCV